MDTFVTPLTMSLGLQRRKNSCGECKEPPELSCFIGTVAVNKCPAEAPPPQCVSHNATSLQRFSNAIILRPARIVCPVWTFLSRTRAAQSPHHKQRLARQWAKAQHGRVPGRGVGYGPSSSIRLTALGSHQRVTRSMTPDAFDGHDFRATGGEC